MKQINENSGEFALWCDDRGMASPEELAKHPLTEEQKENLAIVCEKICEEFGLATEQQESPVSKTRFYEYMGVGKVVLLFASLALYVDGETAYQGRF